MYRHYGSLNHNVRAPQAAIEYLIYHYTACDLSTSLKILCDDKADSPVSAHYLIDESGDIYQLVDEERRAWHAGKSSWEGREDINSWSLGIELVNPGHGPHYRPFPKAQMRALARLSLQIIERYKIKPWHVLGHADIAPARKVDPGELFDWHWLASQGIGIMPSFGKSSASTSSLPMIQELLNQYGYGVYDTGEYDHYIHSVLRAFQMHFTPSHITRQPSVETYQALLSLLEKKETSSNSLSS